MFREKTEKREDRYEREYERRQKQLLKEHEDYIRKQQELAGMDALRPARNIKDEFEEAFTGSKKSTFFMESQFNGTKNKFTVQMNEKKLKKGIMAGQIILALFFLPVFGPGITIFLIIAILSSRKRR